MNVKDEKTLSADSEPLPRSGPYLVNVASRSSYAHGEHHERAEKWTDQQGCRHALCNRLFTLSL